MRVKTAENKQDSSLALIWYAFVRQVTLGVEKPSKTTLDTPVASPVSNPGTAFQSAKRGAGVGLSIYIGQYSDTATGLSYQRGR
jgi:hypothetical protein